MLALWFLPVMTASAASTISLEALKVPEGVSAAQAVAAYQRFTQTDVAKALGIRDPDQVEQVQQELKVLALSKPQPVSPALLDTLEAKLGFRFPPALRSFYQQVGSFEVNGLNGLMVFAPKDDVFFANHQFEDMFARHGQLLSAQDVQAIRRQFFFFALGSYEDDGGSARMLYFHKQQGWFGEVQLKDDDHPAMKATEFPALLGMSAPRTTLDALLVRQLNRVIVRGLSEVAVDPARLGPADRQLRREAQLGRD